MTAIAVLLLAIVVMLVVIFIQFIDLTRDVGILTAVLKDLLDTLYDERRNNG